ncbi:UNVERIFIED_CONTAM: Myb/SANT-like DNA-binding domain-containing protein 2 [Trichonephila clavipes]
MSAAVTADRGFTWSDDETALLLRLWGGNDAQSELTGNKRNFVVYEKISETMNNMGFLRSASQCREKIKRMKREYTLTKQHNEQTTGPKKHMRFYEQFEKILFEKQSRNQKNASKFCMNNSGNELEADEMEIPRKTKCTVRNERKLRKIAPKNVQPKKLHENVEKDDLKGIKRRKLSSQMSLFKCMMDSLTLKFTKYQADFDKKVLNRMEELENERIAMDERIKKMWTKFEEKRRIDEEEHELNIMNAFQDIMNQLKSNHAETT